MGLILKSPWLRQPPLHREIDQRHPLALGLELALSGVSGLRSTDLTGKRALTYSGTQLSGGSPGKSLLSGSIFDGHIEFTPWTTSTPPATILLFQRRNSTSDNGMSNTNWSGNENHYPFSNQYYLNDFWGARWASAISFPSGKNVLLPHVYVATVRDGEQVAYIDGEVWASNTLTADFGLPATCRLLGNNYRDFDGEVFLALMWSRFLTPSEVRSISLAPWALFKPAERRILPIHATAGGAVTGTISSTLANVVAAASGVVTDVGAFASTLAGVVAAFAGTVGTVVTGTIASTLDNVVAAFTGTVRNNGALASTLDATTAAFSGQVNNPGTFGSTLANVVGAFTGVVGNVVSGTIASTLGDVTAALSGTVTGVNVTGTIGVTLAGVSASFNGQVSGAGGTERFRTQVGGGT